jgi:hypothetical protein
MSGPSPETIQSVWTLSLVIFVVVIGVLAVLLTLVWRETQKIRVGAAEIWNVGQKIANNTIHISMLATTNHVAGRILGSAAGVVGATQAIKDHALSCPHCPSCVLGGN